jgi:glyoxylase-like metal-dependent hydrolase (beta-lactamase superfamily II)
MHRRGFVLSAAAAALVMPRRGWAATELDLGTGRLTTLSDGHLELPGNFILGDMPQAELLEIMERYGLGDQRQTITPECNLALYRDGTHTVLFDAGSGPDFMPSAGKILEALDSAGLAPEDITHVVFTHAHPDHLWGVLDDFDEPLFANATHMMGRAEHEYWLDPATFDSIGVARQSFVAGAQRRLEALPEIDLFEPETEILPGILSVATPGHTPGHMAFHVQAGSSGVMVLGDAIGNHHVGFERPGWASGSDQNPEEAASTRLALLDRITAEGLMIAGFHLPEGGIGRAERQGDGQYRFVAGA